MTALSLRASLPAGVFGSDADAERYAQACELQRADMKAKGVRYAVGPNPMKFVAPSGRMFASGESISAADLHGGDRPAWKLLEQAVLVSRIIEA